MTHKPAAPPLLTWGLAYGAGGFAAGFVFGALREQVLIPQFGHAAGHLIEFPFVTLVIAGLGIWIGRRSAPPALLIGLAGVGILLLMESVLALAILRQAPADYLAGYDITAGALFPYGLAVMALAPLIGRQARAG